MNSGHAADPRAHFQVRDADLPVDVFLAPDAGAPVVYRLSPGQIFSGVRQKDGWIKINLGTGGSLYVNPKSSLNESGDPLIQPVTDKKLRAQAWVDHPQVAGRLPPMVILNKKPEGSSVECGLRMGSENPCEYVADVGNKDDLRIVDTEMRKVYDYAREEDKMALFYKIRYRNYKYKKGGSEPEFIEGWTNAEDLRTDGEYKAPEFFADTPPVSPPPDGADVCIDCELAGQEGKDRKALADLIQNLALPDTKSLLEQVRPFVGACLTSPPTQAPKESINTSVFDKHLLPHWKKQAKKAPTALTLHDGNQISVSPQQWVAIDALARTVWSEMGTCEEPYQLAVAGTIVNRAQEVTRKSPKAPISPWAKGKLHPLKNSISRVIESQCQYSVWNSRKSCSNPFSGVNPSLKQALCPPAHEGKMAYMGRAPSAEELANYNRALKIAITAVLQPEKFDQLTQGLGELKHYTSGAATIEGLVKVRAPRLNGEKLNKSSCTVFWKEK